MFVHLFYLVSFVFFSSAVHSTLFCFSYLISFSLNCQKKCDKREREVDEHIFGTFWQKSQNSLSLWWWLNIEYVVMCCFFFCTYLAWIKCSSNVHTAGIHSMIDVGWYTWIAYNKRTEQQVFAKKVLKYFENKRTEILCRLCHSITLHFGCFVRRCRSSLSLFPDACWYGLCVYRRRQKIAGQGYIYINSLPQRIRFSFYLLQMMADWVGGWLNDVDLLSPLSFSFLFLFNIIELLRYFDCFEDLLDRCEHEQYYCQIYCVRMESKTRFQTITRHTIFSTDDNCWGEIFCVCNLWWDYDFVVVVIVCFMDCRCIESNRIELNRKTKQEKNKWKNHQQ